MRKIISALALSFLGLMMALSVFAQVPVPIEKCSMRHVLTGYTGMTCPLTVGADCAYNDPAFTCAACCILDTILTVTDWVFYIVLAFAIIFIIWGAYQIMSAAGAPEKVNTGRNYIIFAIIGLIIGLLAKSIPYIARTIIGA